MSSSSWTISMPGTGSGGAAAALGGSGRVTSSQPPATRRSDLPRGRPSRRTPPDSASSAARVRESPSNRASAASTRSPARPSGTGRERVSAIVLRGQPGLPPTTRAAAGAPTGALPRGVGPDLGPAGGDVARGARGCEPRWGRLVRADGRVPGCGQVVRGAPRYVFGGGHVVRGAGGRVGAGISIRTGRSPGVGGRVRRLRTGGDRAGGLRAVVGGGGRLLARDSHRREALRAADLAGRGGAVHPGGDVDALVGGPGHLGGEVLVVGERLLVLERGVVLRGAGDLVGLLVPLLLHARAVHLDTEQGEHRDEHGGDDDGDVRDVADEPAVGVDEVRS